MEKIDLLLSRMTTVEVMASALALSMPNRELLRQHFEQAASQMEAALLNSQSSDEFLSDFLARIQRMRELISG